MRSRAVRILHQELAIAPVGFATAIPRFLDWAEQGDAGIREAGQDRLDCVDLDLQVDATPVRLLPRRRGPEVGLLLDHQRRAVQVKVREFLLRALIAHAEPDHAHVEVTADPVFRHQQFRHQLGAWHMFSSLRA